jgi:hypothetical protein
LHQDHEICKKALVILQNEIIPKTKKLGKSIDSIPPVFLSIFATLETSGVSDRRKTRKAIDLLLEDK